MKTAKIIQLNPRDKDTKKVKPANAPNLLASVINDFKDLDRLLANELDKSEAAKSKKQ